MADECVHAATIRDVKPSALGCEECLKTGSQWVHLRLCRTCGHVGCCDDSPNRHATKHFHATCHPIIEGYDPPEGWGWCYVDEIILIWAIAPRRMTVPSLAITNQTKRRTPLVGPNRHSFASANETAGAKVPVLLRI
jgi:hypothetical protein